MPEPTVKPDNANPFRLVCDLMIADEKGDYERAVDSQRELSRLGWFVSRKPPEEPKPTRRQESNVNA